jgi:hypothetical protein
VSWCDKTRCLEAIRDVGLRPHRVFAGDLSPRDVLRDEGRFAAELSRALSRFDYRPDPAERVTAFIEKKPRLLYRSTFLDAVVDKLLAWWLAELTGEALSSRVFSYRKGHSAARAIGELSAFLRDHHARHPDPKTRGVYVLRRDIASYGDTMPVRAGGPLDAMLETRLAARLPTKDVRLALALFRSFIAREAHDGEGTVALDLGTATGSALQPVLNNLYLGALDSAMEAYEGFYVRFGDDVLFASESLEVAKRARDDSTRIVRALELSWKSPKSLDLWLNGAGRNHATHEDFRGAQSVEWLGSDVLFAGTRAIRKDKWRALVRELMGRLERTSRLLDAHDVDARARALVAVASAAFDHRSRAGVAMSADLLLSVSSREQLGRLDRLVELRIAELATRSRGVKAFRDVSRKALREMGYVSLVVRHDRAHRTRTKHPA